MFLPPKLLRLRSFLPVLGLAIFVAVVGCMDLDAVGREVAGASKSKFTIGMLILVVFQCAKAARHRLILRGQRLNVSFGVAFIIYMKSAFWGFVSPGRLGELSKIGYLRKYSASFSASAASVVIDRFFDLFAVLSFLAISGGGMGHRWGLPVAIASIVGIGVAVAVVAATSQIFSRCPPTGAMGKFVAHLVHLRGKILIAFISLVIWGGYYGGMFILARSLSLDASPLFIIFCVSAANLISVIPISVAGIGTRDALLVALFLSVGLSPEAAIAYSSFFLAAYLCLALLSAPFLLFGTTASVDMGTV